MFNRKKFKEAWDSGKASLKTNVIRTSKSVYLYDTAIVKTQGNGWEERDTVILSSGGWKTSTTKSTMNAVLDCLGVPYRVVQTKGQWFVECKANDMRVPFIDGMQVG